MCCGTKRADRVDSRTREATRGPQKSSSDRGNARFQHEHASFPSAAACVSPIFPRTGQMNRAGVSLDEHEHILAASSQQPAKAVKGSSPVAMVTAPAADSHGSLGVSTVAFKSGSCKQRVCLLFLCILAYLTSFLSHRTFNQLSCCRFCLFAAL